jgi:1,4-dihydroxy-2-naphthoyl-CoA hydrolase
VTDEKATERIREWMPLCSRLGIRADVYSSEQVVLAVDWSPELCTANGLLHGGAIMTLADSAGAACAYLNLPEGAAGTSTIESKTNFVGVVKSGTIMATATPLHRGTTTIVVETVVRDLAGRLVAKVTQTQLVIRPRP